MKNRTTVERTSERELVVTRTINGPARIVFEAWTKPELFKRWWVPKSIGVSLLSCELDARTGGTYRLVFGNDASTAMEFFGRYLEVTPYSRIVWTNDEGDEGGAVTTVTFEERAGQTLLVLHDLYPSKEALDASGSTDAMPETLEQLDELRRHAGGKRGEVLRAWTPRAGTVATGRSARDRPVAPPTPHSLPPGHGAGHAILGCVTAPPSIDETRIDRWLCAVRLVKTRPLATRLCDGGHVLVNGSPAKPSTKVRAGDRVEARIADRERVVEVVRPIESRVGAAVATTCFVDHSPPVVAKTGPVIMLVRGEGRPSKRLRREFERLRRGADG